VASALKVCLVAGARPNFMKVAPLIRELRAHPERFAYCLVHTGQHYDHDMSGVFFEELEIPPPDFNLGAGGGSHAAQTAKIMVEFERVCAAYAPDVVIVVGDVNSTLAAALVAKKLRIAVAHVEAGLRSGDTDMPEEINRMATDAISDYFFVTEESGMRNLEREGKDPARVHFVGHVMIDNLFHQLEKLKRTDARRLSTAAIKNWAGEYGVLTLHRPANVDDPLVLAPMIEAITEIARDLPIVFPVHPRTREQIKKHGIVLTDNFVVTGPLSYLDFLNLWKDARLVLTDSGGVQEETTAVGVPCITLRDTTERPVTVSEGSNTLVGSDPQRIISAARRALAGQQKAATRPRYWDGMASQRIVSTLGRQMAGA
jgi:UDP-N-acetylglucosamine 2-epimerase (non-hydrolysing)